ncbi:MAG: hypothetical protein ED557_11410 [Balneola sp.]|nr:MAG: hypothetical protein ED557_11410 [Balneola sp.]
MSVSVKAVSTSSELKKFIHFPFELYKDSPYWVPPILMDEKETLSKKKNPAFKHASATYWLAYKGEKIVGRIAGILINAEVEDKKLARFGWIDFIDDEEVSRALINTVENWAQEQGIIGVHGPLGLSDMDPQGMLVEGFDSMATMATTYNYEYYPKHLKKLGYTSVAEWVELTGDLSFEFDEKVYQRTNFIKERFGLEIANTNSQKELAVHGFDIFNLINKTYQDLYGFHPLSNEQISYYVGKYLKFVRKEYTKYVLKDGKFVGFGIAMPSFSKALQKNRGRLFPFGWIQLLKAFMSDEELDLYLISVEPEYAKLGVTRLLFFEIYNNFKKNGGKVFYTNPILKSNTPSKNMFYSPKVDDKEIEIRKRRQCFIKEFSNE